MNASDPHHPQKPTPDRLQVSVEDLEGLRFRENLLRQQAFLLETLQRELKAYLEQHCGLDLAGVDWDINTETGVLTRRLPLPPGSSPFQFDAKTILPPQGPHQH